MIIERALLFNMKSTSSSVTASTIRLHLEPSQPSYPQMINFLIVYAEDRYLVLVLLLDHDSYSDESSPTTCVATM